MAVSNTKTPYVSDIYHRHPGVCNVRVLLSHSCGRIQSGKKRGERKKKHSFSNSDFRRYYTCGLCRQSRGGWRLWMIDLSNSSSVEQPKEKRAEREEREERNGNRRRHVHMYTGHTGDPIYIACRCSNPLCVSKRTRPTARSVSPSLAHHQVDKAIYFFVVVVVHWLYSIYSQVFSLLRLFAQFLNWDVDSMATC